MVRIRLRRVGAKNQPSYRIVAAEKEAPRDGRFLEVLGHYNPRTEPSTVLVDEERLFHWMKNGAQPSDAVFKALRSLGTWERWERFKDGESIEKLLDEAKKAVPEVDPRTRRDDLFGKSKKKKSKKPTEKPAAEAADEVADVPVEEVEEAPAEPEPAEEETLEVKEEEVAEEPEEEAETEEAESEAEPEAEDEEEGEAEPEAESDSDADAEEKAQAEESAEEPAEDEAKADDEKAEEE